MNLEPVQVADFLMAKVNILREQLLVHNVDSPIIRGILTSMELDIKLVYRFQGQPQEVQTAFDFVKGVTP